MKSREKNSTMNVKLKAIQIIDLLHKKIKKLLLKVNRMELMTSSLINYLNQKISVLLVY